MIAVSEMSKITANTTNGMADCDELDKFAGAQLANTSVMVCHSWGCYSLDYFVLPRLHIEHFPGIVPELHPAEYQNR